METVDTGTQANATEATESTVQAGEAKASATDNGESAKTASEKKGTAGEGLLEGMEHIPAEHREKSYKALQAEYTKLNTQFKKLEQYGGPDQMIQWAEYLAKNPRFSEWVQNEQGRNILGVKEDELDEQQQKALNVVRTIAEQVADAKIKQIRQTEIAPLSEKYKEKLLDEHFSTMDKKYEGWRELQDDMAEMSESLSKEAQDNPSFEDLEDLYFKALRKTGKINDYAAEMHNKKLQQMKSKTTEKPSAAPASAPKQFKTIAEAFAYAKQQHGG
jgi:hypothetical protein